MMREFRNYTIKSLSLGEVSCHIMRMFEEIYGEVHVIGNEASCQYATRHWDLLLGSGSITSPRQCLHCNVTRTPHLRHF